MHQKGRLRPESSPDTNSPSGSLITSAPPEASLSGGQFTRRRGEAASIELTVKERILIHLIEYAKYVDELEVPSAITQEGIARETGIDVPNFTQYVRPLIQEGLIRERMAHVKGVRRRRKVYDLTGAGRMATLKVRAKLKSETVRVRD